MLKTILSFIPDGHKQEDHNNFIYTNGKNKIFVYNYTINNTRYLTPFQQNICYFPLTFLSKKINLSLKLKTDFVYNIYFLMNK